VAGELAQIAREATPILLKATADAVPNVRCAAARVLADVIKAKTLPAAAILSDICPRLKELAQDKDDDTSYFAAAALELCAAA
jgi:hypothetical protein